MLYGSTQFGEARMRIGARPGAQGDFPSAPIPRQRNTYLWRVPNPRWVRGGNRNPAASATRPPSGSLLVSSDVTRNT